MKKHQIIILSLGALVFGALYLAYLPEQRSQRTGTLPPRCVAARGVAVQSDVLYSDRACTERVAVILYVKEAGETFTFWYADNTQEDKAESALDSLYVQRPW